MRQLNVLVPDELLTQVKAAAKRDGVKLGPFITAALMTVLGTPATAPKVAAPPNTPVTPPAPEPPQEDRAAQYAEQPTETPRQMSGRTGLPVATCARMIASGLTA